MVRGSASKPGNYSLSVIHGDNHRHYHIKKDASGKYYINDRHCCSTIRQLIEYHQHNSGGLITRLRNPLCARQQDAPPPGGLTRDHWEIDRSAIEIVRELGAGQFGVVMEGVYSNANMRVAVKMMREGAMSEADFIEEAQVMKKFTHPNLVALYGICSQRPIYIVTELMANGCLLDYLKNRPGFCQKNPDTVDHMSIQIAMAMAYLESHSFIHRDLAARNCLVGNDDVVKVADFGLARFVLDDEYTASEGTKFPIKWAAPEVIQFARFSTKSDVWSFGILLWELWTDGMEPYSDMENLAVTKKVPSGYRMDRPPAALPVIYDVMCHCWDGNPDRRPKFAALEKRLLAVVADYDDMEDGMQAGGAAPPPPRPSGPKPAK